MVKSSTKGVKVDIQESVLEVKQNINVFYTVKKGCNEDYLPIKRIDSEKDMDIGNNSNCKVIDRVIDYEAKENNYKMVINCIKSESKQELKFIFKGEVVDTKVVEIINNKPTYVNVTRTDKDDDSSTVTLKITYLDSSNNICEIDGQNIISQLRIQDKEGSNQQYNVTEIHKDYIILSFESSKNGNYLV